MRFDIGKLLITCPISVDDTKLVVIAAGAGKNDPPYMLLCRRRGKSKCRQRGRQFAVRNIDRGKIDRVGGDEHAKPDDDEDQNQTDRQAKTARSISA